MRGSSARSAAATILGILLAAPLSLLAEHAFAADPPHQFDIKPQSLAAALLEFSKQADQQIVGATEVIGDQKTLGVVGRLPAKEALERLLAGTGLKYEFVNSRTVRVLAIPGTPVTLKPMSYQAEASSQGQVVAQSTATDTRATMQAVAAPGAAAKLSQPPATLEEVLVTAQKRSERLQDVPVPVTALNAEALASQNQLRLEDYYSSIPGLSLWSGGHGDANLSIRGVTTGGLTNPTVGITVDDVPFGSTTALGSRTAAPDIDPSDLARIEVLRGPQGTLYGASSIGGLLKFVTVDPSTDGLSGRLQGDVNRVYHGDGAGYGLRGAVNFPVTDTLAVRASAFTRRDPGYIDDPLLHAKGVNQVDVSGGRVSALWRVSSDWSVKVSALLQDTTANGAPYATPQPGLGDLDQQQLGNTGHYSHKITSYAASVNGTIAGAKLVSITGYSVDRYDGSNDLTRYFGSSGAALTEAIFGVDGADEVQHAKTDKFTQEIRLSGTFWQRFDWLGGVFYTHENTPTHDVWRAVDSTTLTVAGILLDDPYPTTYQEYAGFADLTVHFTDQLDVQFGARESENQQTYHETLNGALYGPAPLVNPTERTKDHSFTYLVTPRFKFTPDVMAYARLASGYRPGGPNPTCVLFPVPCEYKPDRTRNYEIGVKGESLQKRLTFDASVYYIDWRDIQLQVADPTTGNTYYTNASQAKSQGIELALGAKPWQDLSVTGWVALNDAKLAAAFPPDSTVAGASGDRLPYANRFSGNVSAEQSWRIVSDVGGFVGGSLSYVGDREDIFSATEQSRLHLPGYVLADIRAGVRNGPWTVSVFVNNVGDRRGVLSMPQIGFTAFAVNYIQPRTAGLSVTTTF